MRLSNSSRVPPQTLAKILKWLRPQCPSPLMWFCLQLEVRDIHPWDPDYQFFRGFAYNQVPANRTKGGGKYHILLEVGRGQYKAKFPYNRTVYGLRPFRIETFEEDLVLFLSHEIYHCYQFWTEVRCLEREAEKWAQSMVLRWREREQKKKSLT